MPVTGLIAERPTLEAVVFAAAGASRTGWRRRDRRSSCANCSVVARTWATIAILNALPIVVAVLLAVTDLAPRPGRGPAFLSAVLTNGALFPLAALAIVLPLFLPIAVAVVAGDSIAGEAQAGTLRYLLARPAGRTRLLVAKLVAVLAFALVTVVIVAAVGYLLGVMLFEMQPLAGTSVSGTTLTAQQLAGRTDAGHRLRDGVDVRGGRFALFFSTFTDSPLGATLGALAVLIASSLLLTLDAASPIAPYLPTRYWLSFVDFFRDPILWRDIVRGSGPAGRLRRGVAGRRVGQLRHQGHQELTIASIDVLHCNTPRHRGRRSGFFETRAVRGRERNRLPGFQFEEHHPLDDRGIGQLTMRDNGFGADRLNGQVQRADQRGGVGRRDGFVLRRPDGYPGRSGRRLVTGVQLAQ